MNLIDAVLLGIVQGLTEFLPVSSSGHLVMGEALLGLRLPGVAFEVVLHLGTLCAVLWVYRARVGSLAAGALRGERAAWRYVGLLALATIPAGLIGILARDWFVAVFARPAIAAGLLIVTGMFVYSLRFTAERAGNAEPSAGQAVWIGIAQAVALLPGLSRSGATVAVGSLRGVDAVAAAEFSFLLSVPAILGAGLLQIGDLGGEGVPDAAALAAGFGAALVVGVWAIRWFVRLLGARVFHRFAWYCWTAGAGYLFAAALVPGLR